MTQKNIILIVEDDPVQAMITKHVVTQTLKNRADGGSYTLVNAENYDGAIAALSKKNVALLISDNTFLNPFLDKGSDLTNYLAKHPMGGDEIVSRQALRAEFAKSPGIQVVRFARAGDKDMPVIWNSDSASPETVEKVRIAAGAPHLQEAFTDTSEIARFDSRTIAMRKGLTNTAGILQQFLADNLPVLSANAEKPEAARFIRGDGKDRTR